MKLKLAFMILLSGVLFTYGQDSTHTRMPREKFKAGDIGLRYQVAYNGSLQSQFTVSGFVHKRIEIGGTFSLNVDHINSSYQGTDSLGNNYETTNSGWGYTLGFDLFLIGHFPIKGRFDLYLGALGIFQVSNTGINNYTFYYPQGTGLPTYGNGFPTYGDQVQNPVQFTFGGGYVLGCQYFFTRHFALGLQIAEWLGYTLVKGNVYYTQTSITGTPATLNSNTTFAKFVPNADGGAYGGITLSYYFSAKKKSHRIAGNVSPIHHIS